MTHPQDDTAETFGDARIDAAVARLTALDGRPVDEHVEIFDDIHVRFRDALEDAAVERSVERSADQAD